VKKNTAEIPKLQSFLPFGRKISSLSANNFSAVLAPVCTDIVPICAVSFLPQFFSKSKSGKRVLQCFVQNSKKKP
jgi:hypothetical protein